MEFPPPLGVRVGNAGLTSFFMSLCRIGSLEVTNQTDIATGLSGPSAGNVQLLRQLVEYTLKHFYPHVCPSFSDFSSA